MNANDIITEYDNFVYDIIANDTVLDEDFDEDELFEDLLINWLEEINNYRNRARSEN